MLRFDGFCPFEVGDGPGYFQDTVVGAGGESLLGFCWIGGGTGKEQAIFLRALREILSPINNPRYLLGRSRIWRILREDYFAVPDVLARQKEFAEVFAQSWESLVGPVQLVYTRTPEGRKMLLRARNHSLSGSFQDRAERVSCWK